MSHGACHEHLYYTTSYTIWFSFPWGLNLRDIAFNICSSDAPLSSCTYVNPYWHLKGTFWNNHICIDLFLLIWVPCQDVRFHELLRLLDPTIKDWEGAQNHPVWPIPLIILNIFEHICMCMQVTRSFLVFLFPLSLFSRDDGKIIAHKYAGAHRQLHGGFQVIQEHWLAGRWWCWW